MNNPTQPDVQELPQEPPLPPNVEQGSYLHALYINYTSVNTGHYEDHYE